MSQAENGGYGFWMNDPRYKHLIRKGDERLSMDPEHTTHGDTSHLACPWCGEDNPDLYEVVDDVEEITEIECGTCEKPIVLVVRREIHLKGIRRER